jgi:hypothetical protein
MERKVGNATVIFDPNKMPSTAGVFSSVVGYQDLLPAIGEGSALALALAVQTTRSIQALAPGDDAVRKMHTYKPPAVPTSLASPRVTPAQIRAEMEPPPNIEAPRLPAPVIAPQQLIEGSQQTRFAIGQYVDTGDPAFVDLLDHSHLRFHGSTGSGKTTLARLIVTQFLLGGGDVTVLDRRRFKDWGIFRGHAHLVDARNPNVFIRHLEQHVKLYEERDALLGQNNTPTLEALAAKIGKAPVRTALVIEELGVQLIEADAMGPDVYGAVVDNLARLASEGGAAGVHLFCLDQMPGDWHKRVRYNLSPMIFHLPDHGGKVVGYPRAYELPQYHCWFDGRIIRASYMDEGEIVDALSVRTVDIGKNEPFFEAERRTFGANDVDPLNPAEVKAAIFAHLERNPDASQAEIRAKLGSSKAWTNACWHDWHNERQQKTGRS